MVVILQKEIPVRKDRDFCGDTPAGSDVTDAWFHIQHHWETRYDGAVKYRFSRQFPFTDEGAIIDRPFIPIISLFRIGLPTQWC